MAPTGPDDDGSKRPRIGVPWLHPDRPLHRRIVRPAQEFLQESTASGLLLLIAAIVALVWVNSPVGDSYERLWRSTFSVGPGRWEISEDLRHWVNEGLMALFFLVVGLEIKREFLTGELRDRRAAALPIIAAVGGMVAPALIFLAINTGGDGARGWGIAMPTDIAFTLGILALASRGAPPGLRSFVLTLAIVDDVLTFLVIALAYPTDVDVVPLFVATGAGVAMFLLTRASVWMPVVFVALGAGMWAAMHASGVPAALAGVVVGLLTPLSPAGRRHERGEEGDSPLARVEHFLLPWTSFLILPLFALANAGVTLTASATSDALRSQVSIGIVAARVGGKIVGIGLASWIAVRLGVGKLPEGTGFAHVLGVGAAAGVAFTVSLFVADLAFGGRPELVLQAKVGILACAPVAGLLGYLLLRSAAGERSSGSDP